MCGCVGWDFFWQCFPGALPGSLLSLRSAPLPLLPQVLENPRAHCGKRPGQPRRRFNGGGRGGGRGGYANAAAAYGYADGGYGMPYGNGTYGQY